VAQPSFITWVWRWGRSTGDLAHDAHDLALPGLEQRGVLLDEVEQVLLGFGGKRALDGVGAAGLGGQGAPQVVDLALQVFGAFPLAGELFGEGQLGRALVAVDADVHQGVAGVEQRSTSSSP
jgi:hypothetical protein